MLDMVFDSNIKTIAIRTTPFPGCSEDYDIQEIEGGYRVTKTCGSGMPIGAPNNYQIDLNFIQADRMFYKMMKAARAFEWDNKISTLEIPYSNWSICVEFIDGKVLKKEGHECGCKSIEPIIKILKATIRWIL